jgi:DNA mismatch repair protein MutS
MAGNRDTPAMRQYAAFKKQHPECVLFFRMGDFYEMFDDDALVSSRVLGITLTQRTAGIPMAGVPYHQLDPYLKRMIEAGHRVAVCDQVQDAKEAKGVVERAVTRVVTPGTLVEESLLEGEHTNHLAAIAFADEGDAPDATVGLAIAELSTGSFVITTTTAERAADELTRHGVRELLFAQVGASEAPPRVQAILDRMDLSGTARPAWHFRRHEALEALREQYGVASLAGFGIDEAEDPTVPPAGAVIRYLRETQALDHSASPTSEGFSSGSAAAMMRRERSLAHLGVPRRDEPSSHVLIDAVALRALEVERTTRTGDVEGSLLGLFRHAHAGGCRTPMGKRLLREWLCAPSGERSVIERRHEVVDLLVGDGTLAEAIGEHLRSVQDVPRIAARVGLGRATPRDVVALGRSLAAIEPLLAAMRDAPVLEHLRGALQAAHGQTAGVAEAILSTCVEQAPASLREGGLIRDGVDAQLDEARALQGGAQDWLAQYQAELVEQHELPNLKVGFNKVFGYYIELPRAQAARAPEAFTRKQTLKNAERYITPELKEYEDRVSHAADRAIQREQHLFNALCARAAEQTRAIQDAARCVSELDVLLAFADKARRRGWCRPAMTSEPTLVIRDGRHPVLDELLDERFVPNDCVLACLEAEDAQERAACALITGPNMAGKSTYIRQVALAVLLAHAGSFVPAGEARIGLTDRILTRVGADDALHRGQSTFMVEMIETASILHHATERSLVIIDELGRGTSTYDGLALAEAALLHLAGDGDGTAPRTLFATHYHEMTRLADEHPGRIRNLHVAVRELGHEVAFLHRILPGKADRSFGVHVARLAGMPAPVVDAADARLHELEEAARRLHGSPTPLPPPPARQLGLFVQQPHPVVDEIKRIELDAMTPLQAFDALRRLRESVEHARESGGPRRPIQ